MVPAKSGDLAQASAANCAALSSSLQLLQAQMLVGVDMGGDSLTGGKDFDSDPELGRDRQVLRALAEAENARGRMATTK